MKPKLYLHEALVVLVNKDKRTATFKEIADEINERRLYERNDQEPVPDYQILQRTTLSNGRYSKLFERVANIRLN